MKKKILKSAVLSLLSLILLFTACKKDDLKSSEKEIATFSFLEVNNPALDADVLGTISGTNISLAVPYGTDVTALVATFTNSTNSIVSIGSTDQKSGITSNNYSSDISYGITAEDGSMGSYKVTVIIAKSDAKDITAFSFLTDYNSRLENDVVGTIVGTSITLTVPYLTNMNGLVASFTTNTNEKVKVGSVEQENNVTSHNFGFSVTYTVTAEDGTSKDFIVDTQIGPPSSEKEITSFSFMAANNNALGDDVIGIINGTEIELTVPYSTDVSSLVATFSNSKGARVIIVKNSTWSTVTPKEQSGITANDFSDPLDYRVVAQDGTDLGYVVSVVVSQDLNIPDANFKAYLVGNSDINTNGDDEIQHAEAVSFSGKIDVRSLNISDLSGIEYFTALTSFNCSDNNISTLDVSNNIALTYFDCSDTNISTLDISNNTTLTVFACSYNNLNSLDVSNNIALTYLSCSDNNISTLDISNNTSLTELSCSDNPLGVLDLSNQPLLLSLSCVGCGLSNLDLSINTALGSIYCQDNNLVNMNLSKNVALVRLSCFSNSLTDLDISKNIALRNIDCYDNNLSSLDLRGLSGLTYLRTQSNAALNTIIVDNVADAQSKWTVANGNIDAHMVFSNN